MKRELKDILKNPNSFSVKPKDYSHPKYKGHWKKVRNQADMVLKNATRIGDPFIAQQPMTI